MQPFRFSQASQRTPDSPIGFFMQQAIENPDIISLAAGMVDSESLPVAEVLAALPQVVGDPKRAKLALQYGTTQGYQPLREKLAAHIAKLDGQPKDAWSPRDVIVTTGSQQLLYLLSELLLDGDDIVIAEAPSYFVYQSVLSTRGVKVLEVPMDDEGMIVAELGKLLDKLHGEGRLAKVKLIYTVDYYQNPSGRTLSLARRKELMALLQKHAEHFRPLVLEDAAYRELRFEGDDIPSLKSLDRDNRFVVYAGTFSKPCAPGFKCGYALMPSELMAPMLLMKGNHDFGSGNLSQHIIDKLLENGDYAKHVEDLKPIYRAKRKAMLEALDECFTGEPGVTWTRPNGGMFVWLKLPASIPTGMHSAFAKAAVKEGVLYVPGAFAYDGPNRPDCEMRLAFGDASPDRIREGIRRLHRAYLVFKQVSVQPAETTVAKDKAIFATI